MNTMRRDYPQTHIQTIGPLMLQMLDLGFEASDLVRVDRAYHFAMKLWSVNFQSSSRPFICHAVGTASKTAEHGGSLEVILAAMMHAAYSTGDFGVRIGGASRRKRRIMRCVIGHEAEDLVFGFHELLEEYGTAWIDSLPEDASGPLSKRERTILFLRVCNDLDDVSDFAFSSDGRRSRIRNFVASSIRLADRIERPDLARKLARELELHKGFEYIPREVTQRHESGHIVVPDAFRKRLIPAVLEVGHRWWTTGSPRLRNL